MRKFISIVTCSLWFLSTTDLDGFDINDIKFKVSHHLVNPCQWGALVSEGFEIDYQAAELAEGKLGGGHFDQAVNIVIPNDLAKTEKEWKRAKNQVAKLIGSVPARFSEDHQWENSSKTVKELLEDAQALAPSFKREFQKIAVKAGATVNFGPGNEFIVKSEKSLTEKVARDMRDWKTTEPEAVARMNDTLRGTLVVEDVKDISRTLSLITELAEKQGGSVVFKNLWNEERQTGYVGIHANMRLPLEKDGKTRYLLAEMQIHIESIVDGTAMSAKERAHLLYEKVRSGDISSEELSAASKLLFLTAMEGALDKVELHAYAR